VPARAGRDARPAAPRSPRRDQPGAPGRYPGARSHRRQRPDRRRDRPPYWHRRRRTAPGQRRRTGRDERAGPGRAARVGSRGGVRPQLAGGQAANRRRAARDGPGRGHDRRRRQRRARAAPGRHRAGWHPGTATGPGTPLYDGYRQATTVAWLGIVACQVGTAFAVRTDHASLRQVGLFTNKLLLAAIGVALAFAATVVYLPALQSVFGTAALSLGQLATVAPFPFVVWGADEIRRLLIRRRQAGRRGISGGRSSAGRSPATRRPSHSAAVGPGPGARARPTPGAPARSPGRSRRRRRRRRRQYRDDRAADR
jgi:Cation transporting ATPase, C-terminus